VSGACREMTLDEVLSNRLPPNHRAFKDLANLRARVKELEAALVSMGMTASAMIDFIGDDWTNAEQFKTGLRKLMQIPIDCSALAGRQDGDEG